MTVPTNPEEPHSDEEGAHGENPPAGRRSLRGQRLLAAGVVAIGIAVVVLVLVYPSLAAPIGTSAGVVAVVVPLVQRLGRVGSSDAATEDEP